MDKKELDIYFIESEIKSLSLNGYDSNISYCGLWCLNAVRTKYKIHKILPFNRFCYLHDCGYSIINRYWNNLTLKEVIKLKSIIDNIFLENMKKETMTKPALLRFFYNGISNIFYGVVRLMTPVYLIGFYYKNKNK